MRCNFLWSGLLVACVLFSLPIPILSQNWTQLSVLNTNWIAIASSADGSILVASGGTTNQLAIYVSTNSGSSWSQTAQPMANSVFFSLAMSADGRQIFAARRLPLNMDQNSTNTNPLFLSTNRGDSWNSTGNPTTNLPTSIAMSADGTVLVAGMRSQNGKAALVYISTNAGAIWTSNQVSISPQVLASSDGQRLSAFLTQGSFSTTTAVLLTSTNAGVTWVTNKLPGSPYGWDSIVSSSDGIKLAAVGRKSHSGTYVCTSANGGASWKTNEVNASTYFSGFEIVSSADGTKLSVPTSGPIFISLDSGVDWIQTDSPVTNWIGMAMSADGSKVVATGGQSFTTPNPPSGNLVNGSGGIWALSLPPAPTLGIKPSDTAVVLSWIIPSTNLVLQQSSALNTLDWTVITNATYRDISSLSDYVTLPAASGNTFFWLATP